MFISQDNFASSALGTIRKLKLKVFSPPTDPDIVSGDGVYSRHATSKVNGAPGRFSFRFHVDDNENGAFVATLPQVRKKRQLRQKCCGSIVAINPDETEKTGIFRRSSVGPVVNVFPRESNRGQDATPPNRIGDLKVFI